MFFERCASIIIYAVLLNLNPGSAIATVAVTDFAGVGEETRLPDSAASNSASQAAPSPQLELQPLSQTSPPQLAQDNSSEPISTQNLPVSESLQTAIDRYWALGAMALTSSIAIFLLWLLFKKPQDTDADITATSATSTAPTDSNLSTSKIPTSVATASVATESLADSTESSLPKSPIAHIDVVRELVRDLQLDTRTETNKVDRQFKNDLQISRRRKAIWELTKTGDYRSIEPLVKIMPEVSATDKSLIVEAVSQITRRSFRPIDEQLFANLQDPSPEVRLSAIRNLKHLYQFVTPAIGKIALMQSDPDYRVRQTAIQTLRQLNADPLPTFERANDGNSVDEAQDSLVSGGDSEANLHLVAYLLAELDAEQ